MISTYIAKFLHNYNAIRSLILTTNKLKDWIVTLYNVCKVIMKLSKSFKCSMQEVMKVLILIPLTGNSKRSRNIISEGSDMKLVTIIAKDIWNHGSWEIPPKNSSGRSLDVAFDFICGKNRRKVLSTWSDAVLSLWW